MARAKRTNRAEARRRHRASFAETPVDGELLTADAAEDAPDAGAGAGTRPPAARSAATSGADAPPPRPGIAAAFRSSFRPADIRGDLRALPRSLRHWSFLVAVIMSGVAVALVPLLGANSIALTLFGYFSGAAPIGSAFLAGFFAPRASYLAGGLAGLASVGFMALAFSVGPFGGLLPTQTIDGAPLALADAKALVLTQALFYGVPSAALFAAMAAWYRRFLNAANPNRRTRRPAPSTGRRPDGRQPRKNQQRPMLARRR